MPDNSYTAIHEKNRKILLFSRDYLNKNSETTKALLLAYGTCPDCASSQLAFSACSCQKEPERWPDSWATAISNNDWTAVEPALEKDRLKIKSAIAASVRKSKFKYCAGMHTPEDVAAIRSLQGDTCYFCDTALAGIQSQVDHLTSITDGGGEWPSNLAIACVQCNGTKGSKDEREFWEIQKRKLGVEFVRTLRAKRSAQRKFKDKLDRVRVKEIKGSIAQFEAALNAAIDPSLGVEIEVEFEEHGIAFRSDNVAFFSQPCSHRQVAGWARSGAESWVKIIIALHDLLRPPVG